MEKSELAPSRSVFLPSIHLGLPSHENHVYSQVQPVVGRAQEPSIIRSHHGCRRCPVDVVRSRNANSAVGTEYLSVKLSFRIRVRTLYSRPCAQKGRAFALKWDDIRNQCIDDMQLISIPRYITLYAPMPPARISETIASLSENRRIQRLVKAMGMRYVPVSC